MAAVALADNCVIIPDSQRQRDVNDSDFQPDRLQAAKIKAILELKFFDLGWVSIHCARGCRELKFSPQALIRKYTEV